jgi:parvulin-like peptidyl-prolyl isomerase
MISNGSNYLQVDRQADTPLKQLTQGQLSGREIIELLQKYSLLPLLQRELILDDVLVAIDCTDAEIFDAYKAFYQKYQINSDRERDEWLQRHSWTLNQLEHSVLRSLKLERFKRKTFGSKVAAYFLQRKHQLDRVIYSLLRVRKPDLAQELFFRIQADEASFTELVKQYSQGQEAELDGLLGPHELSIPHPLLAQKLRSLKPGQLSPPIQIAEWFVIVRLEKYFPARLDEQTESRSIDELYEQWMEEQLRQLTDI